MRVASIFICPTAIRSPREKYPYKLRWMDRLRAYASQRLLLEEPLVLAGDYNVIPAPEDVHNPAAWADDALFRADTRARNSARSRISD